MNKVENAHQVHTIAPLFCKESKVLILGSFPSVKSREAAFYYGHAQNRFWRVISSVFDSFLPTTNEEKRELIISNNLALWDVIASCDITGSSDSSIKNVVPNNIELILENSKVERIFTNGGTAYSLYNKYLHDRVGIEAVKLPSTSPANASWSLERLCSEWSRLIV